MTTTIEVRAPARPGVRDLRRSWQIALALIIVIGPLAITVLRIVLPYRTIDDSSTTVASIAANPMAEALVVWLGLLAALTIVPGVLAVAHLARRRAPLLATLGAVLSVFGFTMLFSAGNSDLVTSAAVSAGIDQPTIVRVLDAVAADGAATVATSAFVVGHILGVILLGAALWRARLLPAWVAIALIISQPLHLVAAVVVASPTLDGLAWGLTTLGFAAAALVLVRTRPDDWDLPPAAPTLSSASPS